jgi:histidyl-tRNA synthetase
MKETEKKLSTDAYKGVRDFYPEDMAVQSYIFETWAETAESFGFDRYDASVLEPSELYKSKGAENEEMINEQTYTFTDRGDREVTLRPEMTPTVARMIAGRRRELSFPVRWYSIPNLFRYERAQRGRLREHWQLNADIFGTHDAMADVEIILLASAILKGFGAKDSDFEIFINNRGALNDLYAAHNLSPEQAATATAVIDRKRKMSEDEFKAALADAAGPDFALPTEAPESVQKILSALSALGVVNASYDPSIVRGFNYYTGTVFEIFDTHEDNRRALLGGGRYDNLTGLFGGEPIPGIGFGMGDVTMRDFLETHNLLPVTLGTKTQVMLILPDLSDGERAEKVAKELRDLGVNVAVDLSGKKLGDQIARADKRGIPYVITVGEQEEASGTYTLKKLADGGETKGTLTELANTLR